jgi:hypothetical protein
VADFEQKEGDTPGARDALSRASEHPDCSGEWRNLVENKRAALDA